MTEPRIENCHCCGRTRDVSEMIPKKKDKFVKTFAGTPIFGTEKSEPEWFYCDGCGRPGGYPTHPPTLCPHRACSLKPGRKGSKRR